MKQFTSKTQKIGQKGEDIAVRFLVKQGFSILERNYTQKWGEIDIIARQGETLHFIEVKTLARNLSRDVSRETPKREPEFQPLDNVTPAKFKKFARTVESYLNYHNVSRETHWVIDICSVLLDRSQKLARVKLIENIII